MNFIFPGLSKTVQAAAKVVANFRAAVTKRAPVPIRSNNVHALLLHLCDFDHTLYDWVLRWLALPLQQPGAKMHTALVFNGAEGTGKGLFFERVMCALHGDHACHLQADELASTLNEWAINANYVVVNNLDFSGLRKNNAAAKHKVAAIKSLITSNQVIVEKKYAAARVVPNEMNFIFTTSSPDFLPESVGDRRFFVIECPPPQSRAFYSAVISEIDNGGIEAFGEYLLRLDLAGFNQGTLPPVAARRAAA